MRFNSLRNRFLLLMVIVLVITGLLTTWLASRAIAQRFQSYVASSQKTNLDRLAKMNDIEPGMIKWLHLAGGYGHLRYWVTEWQPSPVMRSTRVGIAKMG